MVDLEVLSAFGLDAESLKAKFTQPREKRGDKLNAFIDRVVNRCRGGRDMNLENANVYHALDTAWDAAFNQISPTLLTSIAKSGDQLAPDSSNVLDILRAANLDPSQVLVDVPDPKSPGKKIKRLQLPAFFAITVPLCMAYVKIRQAKLVNDRKQIPFLKYSPVISDQLSRMRCELITQAIDEQSRQYGYFDTFKQAVFQMLHYSECLQFPVEEWHEETQWLEEKAPFEKSEEPDSEKTVNKIKVKRCIVKEGIRYHLPHPSRTYWDRVYPSNTLNTGTGCRYAGYWRIVQWKDVMNNPAFYNLEEVGYDSFYQWFTGRKSLGYWTNYYKGCALTFPGDDVSDKSTSLKDSEKAISKWYTREWADKPICIHEHIETVIPKEVGLGDYDCPVDIRLVLAADDTVVYAAPTGYDPSVIWWGYDVVHGRTHNASMTLECLPFQDQFSNLLSQHLLAVKQNLMNITLVDEEIIPEKAIAEIENMGERWWRKINILRMRFSEKLRAKIGQPATGIDPIRAAVISHKFPVQNTNELLNAMKVILDTMERVLVMSSQEVGQASSHEQTREEVRQISTNTSTRVQFTDTGIDSSIDAWKRQLYNAKMAHGRMSFYAQVPMEVPFSEEKFKKLGFTAVGPYDERTRKQYVKANGTALLYERFASDRDGQNRINELESAKMMIQVFEIAMQNPMLAPAIGPDQALKLINQISSYMGLPRDFKLENTGQAQTMQDQVMQMVQQLSQQVGQEIQSLQQDVSGALQNVVKVNKQQDGQLAQIAQRLEQLLSGSGNNMISLPAPDAVPGA